MFGNWEKWANKIGNWELKNKWEMGKAKSKLDKMLKI